MSHARAVVTAIVALAVLASPAGASGHLRTGTIAVDYRATVLAADTPAYSVQIFQSDHGLSLTVHPGHVVVMLGYLGEPVFRLDAAGLAVNAGSPTAVVVGLLRKAQRVTGPTPVWRLQRGRHVAVWHDARTQGLSPGVERGPWTVPLIVDGRRATLRGELRRFPAPSLWLWLAILACLLAAGAAPLLLRRDELVPRGAIRLGVVAAGASVVVALAFALDAYASPGTWIEAFNLIVFVAIGLGALLRGPENVRVGAAIWLGLLSLAVGLLNGPVFLHPIVLAVLPSSAARAVVLAAIVAGVDAAALGCIFYVNAATAAQDAGPEPGFRPMSRG